MSSMTDHMPNGLVVARKFCNENEGAVHTYSKRLFVIEEKDLYSLTAMKQNDSRWGECWRWRKYSARENHGMLADRSYLAGGLDLGKVLEAAGLSHDERKESFIFSAGNYRAVVDHPLNDRYYFDTEGHPNETPALLAFESAQINNDGDIASLKKFAPYPKLFLGQQNKNDINQCSFVRELCGIQPADMPSALNLYIGDMLWMSMSLADIFGKSAETAVYRSFNQNYICYGIDLYSLLVYCGLEQCSAIYVKDAGNAKRMLGTVARGTYMLAWYSVCEDNGAVMKNHTDLKLYGNGLVVDDILSLHIWRDSTGYDILPDKMPWGTEDEISASSFYCAVEKRNKKIYYYFSKKELAQRYSLNEVSYPYNDHRVKKNVYCRGVLLANIVDSLCGEDGRRLCLPNNWHVQYLEEDAYHSNTPTYIDCLRDLRGCNRAMLAFEKKECFEQSDSYHKSDNCYSKINKPCVYRSAKSANEAAVKYVMGMIIKENSSELSIKPYRLVLKNADDSGSVIKESIIKGALNGMRIGLQPPALARFSPAGKSKYVLNTQICSEAEFLYREKPVVNIYSDGVVRRVCVSELKGSIKTIPEDEDFVRKAAVSGDAAILYDNRETDFCPKRNIYLDMRSVAGGTAPFGYGIFTMYRYDGWPLTEFLKQFGISAAAYAASGSEGKTVRILNAEDCFVAFRHSESKGIPYNTAVYKRRVTEYEHARLVRISDGGVIAENITNLTAESAYPYNV